MESTQIENTIIRLCRQHPQGLTDGTLKKEMESVPIEAIATALNKMLTTGTLNIFQDAQMGVVYKEQNPDNLAKFKGLSKEDRLIYQLIEQSGNKGIWSKDLKIRSSLQVVQITKILKTLEARKLVKSVASVASKNRKVYMLFNLEPHIDVTGDVWYTGADIDVEFINILRKQAFGYISQKGYASAEEITAFIRKTGVSKVQLKVDNVQTIIETLIYDGKVETVDDPRGPSFLGGKAATLYRPTKINIQSSNGFTQAPCSVCPVYSECSPDGEISPSKCVYLTGWLEF